MITNTVKKLNREGPIFNVVIVQKFSMLNVESEIIINCQDENNQSLLIEQLLISGFKLIS